jgi:uncharacterized protein (DUF934 family)
MPTLIKGRDIAVDDWHIADDASFAPEGRLILPAEYVVANEATLLSVTREVGVRITGDAEAQSIAKILDRVSLIAIDFPAFNDGRGLSLAVLLRTRYGYTGELRAIGDVHPDMLHYLERCGFDSFLLPDGRDPQIALSALDSISDFYQGSVIEPLPAFRRIARGCAAA